MTGRPRARFLLLLFGLLLGGCVGSDRATAQGPEGVAALLQEGDYEEAITLLHRERAATPGPESTRALASVLLEAGRYDDAEALLRDASEGTDDADLELLLGRSLLLRGQLDEADRVFAAAAAGTGGAALLAEMHRGEILLRRGEREAALALFDRFIDVYNNSSSLGSRELQAVAAAVAHLGITNPALYQDALMAYDEAIAADPENLEAHLELGFLFLERYNIPDAIASFREVLRRRSRQPMALYGLAEAAYLEGSEEGAPLLDEALSANPNLVPALILRARSQLGAEEVEATERDLASALDVDPTATQALAVLAATRLLQGETEDFESIVDRALRMNSRDAAFFVTAGELASRGRFYEEAAELAVKGIGLDTLAWDAYGTLGMNLLRLGAMEEGRANLEIAFGGDPYNVWYKNTLDLLDTMEGFESYSSDRIRVYVDPEDGEGLALYMLDVAERAYAELAERYGYAPTPPIRVEAFRRSGDFSVRTFGLTGIGALGVSFGNVLAMDSPAARGTEGFHWASTLWHEMAHAFHLGMTDHRVPRWFSEGLAVHEERRAGPGWGMRPSIPFFAAYEEGELRSPSELSQSFVRPRSPDEVGFAYIMGSLVMLWIEEEWGADAILGMLEGYRNRTSPDEVIRSRLDLSLAEFDRGFDAWLRDRYSGGFAAARAALELRETGPQQRGDVDWLRERVAQAPNDVEARIALAAVHFDEERYREAIAPLLEARDIFPENPDPRGPNRFLAEVYRELGDSDAAVEALVEHLAQAAGDYRAQLLLADLFEERNDSERAVGALEEAINVYPFEIPVHERLALLYREIGNAGGEVRERKAILALDPVDRAGALYELALAQLRDGDRGGARTSVMGALELAPRFPEAQDLLLEIMQGGAPNGR
ncbi:MAG: tetratricopeptide repeat protein [Gemmatimonadota bacterium]